MKYVIILLLSTTGIEEIKLKSPDCNKLAESWRQVNTTYYSEINEDPKLQGNYTHAGKLLMGYMCE
jgi:hypothetical protein